MEKAIEIKRRAQRCVQNGDLDGALREYEKLVETPESDPYNFVLLADLLYKKAEQARAAERYLDSVTAYEKAGLYKNAIAVCKKMMRLSLSQAQVLRHLAELHALDGLTSEASIYYSQFAEYMVRANKAGEAAGALRKAFDNGRENISLLERLAEVLLLEGENTKAATAMREAATHWRTRKHESDARRCEDRANHLDPASVPLASSPGADPAEAMPMLKLPAAVAPLAAPRGDEPAATDLTQTPTAKAGGNDFTRDLPLRAPVPASAAEPAPGLVTPFGSAAPPPPAESSMFERSPRFVAPPSLQAPLSIATPPVPEPMAPEPSTEVSEDLPEEGGEDQAGVYQIGAEEEAASYETALQAAAAAEPAAQGDVDVHHPTPSMIARRPEGLLDGVSLVEHLLQRAQDEFRAGDREKASQALVEAALTYEKLGHFDSAATIFRSLGRGGQAPQVVMEQWLANCERRDDREEGSQVACELGDRALNEGQDSEAATWFEHAGALDPKNETVHRRLNRMTGGTPLRAPAPPTPSQTVVASEPGRVEVALGRGQAVTFDLAGLLQEFQRGVDTQLEGDAQGHYDLGMAYHEMGLHAQAVESFRVSLNDVRWAGRAHEMIARCHADSGEHAEAVSEFEHALRLSRIEAAGEAELRFQLALSMAAIGDMAGAVAQLEIADMRFPGRSDIQERLADWRRAFGQAA